MQDIETLSLQGANFFSQTALPFLGHKAALIYGRNGSGKSTIAKAFRKIKGENMPSIISAVITDKDGKPVTLTENEKAAIYVFDEDFVAKNVRIEGDALKAIVMFGEQGDLAGKIHNAEVGLAEAKESVEDAQKALQEYEGENSPDDCLQKINSVLRQDGGWADRDKMIKGNAQKSKVGNDTYKKFTALSPSRPLITLAREFNKKLEQLRMSKSGEAVITLETHEVPDIYQTYSFHAVSELLQKRIEPPELTEREQYILRLVQKGKKQVIDERLEYLSKPEADFYPYCLQDLTHEHKSYLTSLIQSILADAVKEHQEQLEGLILPELNIDLSGCEVLPSFQVCYGLIEELNHKIRANNVLLNQKIDDPYTPLNDCINEFSGTAIELNETLNLLEAERADYNSRLNDTKLKIDELHKINDEIAHHEIIDLVRQYKMKLNSQQKAIECYKAAVSNMDIMQKEVEQLTARRKNITIAIDLINSGLKYIFFSDKRLRVELSGDHYVLLSDGHNVSPKNMSVGERNILGLCYFFVKILQRKDESTAYKDEYIILIDDPVSSYDSGNRIGILSFIKHELGKFLNSNSSSKAVIMTHDLYSFFEIKRIFDELKSCWDNIFPDKKFNYACSELRNREIKHFKQDLNEYTELMKLVYKYGLGDADEYDLFIGNIMRQMLEAFSTFLYRKGPSNISTDEKILSAIPENTRDYFRNLMYRLLLDGGSHRKGQAQSIKIDFPAITDEAEKKRAARDILCFMYRLNKRHVLAHLGEDTEENLESWYSEIVS